MFLTYDIAQQKLVADSADKKILEFLSAIRGFQNDQMKSLNAKQLLIIAQRLGLTEASVRMALSRQTKQGKLLRVKGRYMLASSQKEYLLPRFWLDIKSRSIDWQGDWLLVNVASQKLGATVSRRLSVKAELLGLKYIPALGWIRPNNLLNLREEVLYHFQQFVDESNILIAQLAHISPEWEQQFCSNWSPQALNQFYQNSVKFMQTEISNMTNLDDDQVLIRSFTIGRLLVEYLSKDPWLPERLIDLQARSELVNEASKLYQLIKPAWMNVLVNR
ncbi:hypothetical protein [Aliiglaciecola sp. LCG003]|uniref:hypothetical protein n=1 Tax=Aliiglaciecola sp. LCG003 TaxID=3053655 RepID=UPI00257346BA|nr:hypothetical protein [Aliiglaciecola sp. LCG003]WJG10890.1 hypothetical protein QR722_07640 [Aliiglaciecola sp. LCG003]